jgi:hypothetical protein
MHSAPLCSAYYVTLFGQPCTPLRGPETSLEASPHFDWALPRLASRAVHDLDMMIRRCEGGMMAENSVADRNILTHAGGSPTVARVLEVSQTSPAENAERQHILRKFNTRASHVHSNLDAFCVIGGAILHVDSAASV